VTLVVGANMFTVAVTAQDGIHQTVYTINITIPDPVGPPPPPWYQAYAVLGGALCAADWGPSWAEWAVPFSGGAVCNRVIFFSNGAWWAQPGFAFSNNTTNARLWN
jgi:hypothetical protein